MSLLERGDGDGGNVVRDEEGRLGGDADVGGKRADRVDEGLRGRGYVAGRRCAVADAGGGGQIGQTLGAGLAVEVEEIRQGNGVREAVRHMVALAKAMRDRVDVADEAAREGSPGEMGGSEHGFAGFDFAAVGAGGAQVGEDEPHRLDRLDVDVGVMEGVRVGFDSVREGIHAGGGSHGGGQADGDERIKNGGVGGQARIEDGLLAVARRIGEDGGGRCLAAGAGRGGRADEGKPAVAEGQQADELGDALAMRRAHADEFGRIDHGAAADGDHRVAGARAQGRQALRADFVRRIGKDLVEDGIGNIGGLEYLGDARHDSGLYQNGIGDDEGFLGAENLEFGGDELEAARARQQGRDFLRQDSERPGCDIEPDTLSCMLHRPS